MNELPRLEPVTIVVTSYNRMALLEKTIDKINERTFYPYRIIVVDNNSNDGSQGLLKMMKVQGRIFDHILLPDNIGQSRALNEAFSVIEKWENELRRPSSDFFITTNDDIFPPMLGQENCWLRQMIDILERNEPIYGGICMRIQRTSRNNIDENTEIIPCYKGFPSVFRLMRRSDIRKLGDRPWGRLQKWDSNTSGDKLKLYLNKKFGFTTHIYADHAGFMLERKGYGEDAKPFTVADNKLLEYQENPYPDIDPLTNVPVKINCPKDATEQRLRDEYNNPKGAEVTLIALTCYRPDGLRRLIDSIRANTTVNTYKTLIVADNGDTGAYNYCLENNISCILSSFPRDFVAQANLGIYACDTPYFVILADDMEMMEPGWLDNALKIFKERFPDNVGLMSFNDGIQNGRIFTSGMSSKKFVQFVGGYLYYPLYKHYGGDNEVSFLAKQLNLYHYAETVKVAHYHPTNHNPEYVNAKDETYINSEKFNHRDQQLKKQRKGNVEELIKNKNYYDYL